MKLNILYLLIVLVIPIISASTAFYVPKDSNYSVRFNCEIDDAICSNLASCGVSVYYFNSTPIIRNKSATNLNEGEFEVNLTYNDTKYTGEYKMNLVCYEDNVNGSSTIYYEVNPSGIRSSPERTDTITRSIYFMLIIGILFFIGFIFTSNISMRYTALALSVLFFLISINLIFTSLRDETINPKLEGFFSAFTTISWYIYWFIAALLIIIWGLTFINTYIYKKNLENARRFGG